MYKRADIYVCALGRKGMGICMDFNQEKEQLKVPKELPEENDIRRSSSKKGIVRRAHGNKSWLYQGIAMSLVFAMLFSCFYGVFRSRAKEYEESPLETTANIAWLYQSCYLLYRDLYNVQHEEILDYTDIYLEMDEAYSWMLDEKQRTEYGILLNLVEESRAFEEYLSQSNLDENWLEDAIGQGILDENLINEYIAEGNLDSRWLERYRDGSSTYNLNREAYSGLNETIVNMETYFANLEAGFKTLNNSYDYIIEDQVTGKYVTNMSVDDRNRSAEAQYFRLSFTFDSLGNVSIGDTICGKNESYVRKYANEAIRESSLAGLAGDTVLLSKYVKIRQPVDCTITFAVSKEAWDTRNDGFYVGTFASNTNYEFDIQYYSSYYNDYIHAYYEIGLPGILLLCMLFMALLGLLLPIPHHAKPWKSEKMCALSFELLFCIGFTLFLIMTPIMILIGNVASGQAGGAFGEYLEIPPEAAHLLVGVINLTALMLFFFSCWYIGICTRAVKELGLREYIKKRSLIYSFFPYMKGKALDIYNSFAHMDLTRNANRSIIKLLLANGIVLFFISSLWVGGFAVTLIYSLVLYLVLRKYISQLQKRYGILLKAVDEIAEGNLNVTINEDLGVFEPFREQIFKIQDGLQKAVDVEVKSQRMKVELVTNMSHDLKTPLTAIITYVNLLKEDITEAQRREYLAILERKSLRLKSLIEDLFEFSKANSQNITLNIMDVDIMNLVKQVAFEMSDKINEAGLDVRMNLTEEKIILPLDNQKTYRIYENLFGNIAKYALTGTRVYVNGFRIGNTVVITLKNISAQEITVDSSELTERFVRGDASRNTEGSGLGLAIAKSFTELQGGELSLEVDGDLFKVTTTWHMIAEQDLSRGTPEYPVRAI